MIGRSGAANVNTTYHYHAPSDTWTRKTNYPAAAFCLFASLIPGTGNNQILTGLGSDVPQLYK